jgi:rhamnosyltransferase
MAGRAPAVPNPPLPAETGAEASAGVPQKLAALVTAYHPDDRLPATVAAALEHVDEVIVVDNTPGGSPLAAGLAERPGVRVLGATENLGLAAALNLGLSELSAGVEAVFFLDQDTVLSADLVPRLARHLADPTIAVAAPTAWDAVHDAPYRVFGEHGKELADKEIVITSGMLVRRAVLASIGGFREDFFVDYVDLDFCLRVRAAGGRLVEDKLLKMAHSIGERREHRFLGVKVLVVHHAAWRQYWMARNGTILIREHLRRNPKWALTNTLFLARWSVVTALFAEQRGAKTTALLRGFRDGFTGRVTMSCLPAGARYRGAGAKAAGAQDDERAPSDA